MRKYFIIILMVFFTGFLYSCKKIEKPNSPIIENNLTNDAKQIALNKALEAIKCELNINKDLTIIDDIKEQNFVLNYDQKLYKHKITMFNKNKNMISFSLTLFDKDNENIKATRQIEIEDFLTIDTIKDNINKQFQLLKIYYPNLKDTDVNNFVIDNLEVKGHDEKKYYISKNIKEKSEDKVIIIFTIKDKKFPKIANEFLYELKGFKQLNDNKKLLSTIQNIKFKFNQKPFTDFNENDIIVENYDQTLYKVKQLKIIRGIFNFKIYLQLANHKDETVDKIFEITEHPFTLSDEVKGKIYDEQVKVSKLSFIFDSLDFGRFTLPSMLISSLHNKTFTLDGKQIKLLVKSFDDELGMINLIAELNQSNSFTEHFTLSGFKKLSTIDTNTLQIKLLDNETLLDLDNLDINTNNFISFNKLDKINLNNLLIYPKEVNYQDKKIKLTKYNLAFEITNIKKKIIGKGKNKENQIIAYFILNQPLYKGEFINNQLEKQKIKENELLPIYSLNFIYPNETTILNAICDKITFSNKAHLPSYYVYKADIDYTLLNNFLSLSEDEAIAYQTIYFEDQVLVTKISELKGNDFNGKLYYSLKVMLNNITGVTINESYSVNKKDEGFKTINENDLNSLSINFIELKDEDKKKFFKKLINDFKNQYEANNNSLQYDNFSLINGHLKITKIISFLNDQQKFYPLTPDRDTNYEKFIDNYKLILKLNHQNMENNNYADTFKIEINGKKTGFMPATIQIIPQNLTIEIEGNEYKIKLNYQVKMSFINANGIGDNSLQTIILNNVNLNLRIAKNLF